MTMLGKFTKQPREVEIYAIQFAEDMTPSDDLTAAYCALTYNGAIGVETTLTAPYDATLADAGRLFYTSGSITLPDGAPIGYTLLVSNTAQNAAITVGPFNVPARGAIIVLRTASGWTVDMSAASIIVSVPGDHRVRIVVSGGRDGVSYKAQISAETAEGRVMEDEMTIRIKEI